MVAIPTPILAPEFQTQVHFKSILTCSIEPADFIPNTINMWNRLRPTDAMLSKTLVNNGTVNDNIYQYFIYELRPLHA